MAGDKRSGARKVSRKKKKDPNAPKRPRSAYILFCSEQRDSVKQQYPDLKPSELMRNLGVMWKNMSADEKRRYEVLAEKDKHRYDTESSHYTAPEYSESEDDAPRRKKKKSRDPNAPKRAMSAYLFYGMVQRPIIKQQSPHLRSAEIMKQIADMWRGLSEEDREEYNRKAEADKERYQRELGGYKAHKKAAVAVDSDEDEEDDESDEEDDESEEDDD